MSRTTSSFSIVSQQQIVVTILVRAFLLQTIIPINSFQCAARKLVENVPLVQNQTGVVGVWTWNATNPYSPLSDFRSEAARKYYTVWPEDIPGQPFQYPCEDRASKLMLENFTDADIGGLIQTVQYFDLGIVEHFRPYWIKHKTCSKCWPSQKPLGWPPIYCAQVDIYNLYWSRAFSTILHGLRFGVIMILIQQVAFVVIAILIPVYYLHRSQGFHKMCLITKQRLQCLKWVSTFVVSLHLLALAVAGSLFVEGHVHTGDWRMAAMFTLAYYYRMQTACAFAASFLGQCADSLKSSHLAVSSGNSEKVQAEERKKEKSNIEMLIGQVVVCVVMVEYLYLTDDDHQNFMIQVVFGVVTVAVTFSMVTVIAVGGSSLRLIMKALWTHVRSKWSGNVEGLSLRLMGKVLGTYMRSLRNGS